jgi:hydrogenase-4 component E
MIKFAPQLINLFATLILLLSFAMISQRRIVSLINLFMMQGLALVITSFLLAYATNQPDLYVSGALTLVLKVILIPWMLHRMIRKLNVRWDVETLLNVPTTMLVGIALVIFSFSLALPVSRLSNSLAGGSLGIALSCVMLSFLMLITRSKAVPQVIGFLSMENGLIFAATAVTNGMPMIVEFGIALDVLVGVLILGVFMFQIREKFDTLDIHHLETLKDDSA